MIRHLVGCCKSGPTPPVDLSRYWRRRPTWHVSENGQSYWLWMGWTRPTRPQATCRLACLCYCRTVCTWLPRTGLAGHPEAPFTTVQIVKDDQRNQRDICAYLAKAVHEDVLAARLAEAGMDAAEFNSLLAKRCGGVAVSLLYVLYELGFGPRRA